MLWRRCDGDLRWRHWGDESVVFSHASGATHLLNLVDRQVIGLFVLDHPISQGELVERLARALEIDADPALDEYVATLLPQLVQVGLIETVPL